SNLAAQEVLGAVRHMQHIAWVEDNGPPLPGTHLLARSNDGYLWLGANDGLLRFDGTRFSIYDGTRTPTLKSAQRGWFRPLLTDRDGTVWFARPDGVLLTLKDGVFRQTAIRGTSRLPWMTRDSLGRLWLYDASGGIYNVVGGRAVRATMPRGVPDTGLTR